MQNVNFNSHAHVERDKTMQQAQYDSQISTHTLTWSVTTSQLVTNMLAKISTHTLTWSVTTDIVRHEPMYRNFNSHAHVERDGKYGLCRYGTRNFNSHAHVERDAYSFYRSAAWKISTHTLTWSVTFVPCPPCQP